MLCEETVLNISNFSFYFFFNILIFIPKAKAFILFYNLLHSF